MTVIHIILMAPYIQTNNEELILYNNDVTYYVITCKSAFEYNNDVTYYVITCKSAFDCVCVVDYRHAMYTGWRNCQCQCACRVFARQWLGEWIIPLHFLLQSLQSDHVKEIFFQVAGFH